MGRRPLEGLRVLEFSLAWAVPYATRMLADMGAEVIKIESHTHPDTNRIIPFPENQAVGDWWNTSGMFHCANHDKLMITLDLNSREGLELCQALVKVSDVVAENFAARVLGNFGLDYESLRQIRPDLVMLSSTAFGHSGPWANYIGYGWGLEPMVGMSHITGYEDGPPLRSSFPHTDLPSALMASFAILAALEHRALTGEGQWIDLAQYQVGVGVAFQAVMDYMMNGRVASRTGNRHEWMAPHGVYRCAGGDDWIAIAIRSDEEWEELRRAMGNPAWAQDERFRTPADRHRYQDELDHHLGEWTRGQGKLELMAQLQAKGVAAGAVLNQKELLLDPHLTEREFFPLLEHPHPLVARRHQPGVWHKLSKTPGEARAPAPMMGQHNEYVLGELLGLATGQVADLEEKGVVGKQPAVPPQPPAVLPVEKQRELGLIETWDPDYRVILGYE